MQDVDDEFMAALQEAEALTKPIRKPSTTKRARPSAPPPVPVPVPVPVVAVPVVPDGAKDKFTQFFMYICLCILKLQNLGQPDPFSGDEPDMLETKRMVQEAKVGYEHFKLFLERELIPEIMSEMRKRLPQNEQIYCIHEHYLTKTSCLRVEEVRNILRHHTARGAWTNEPINPNSGFVAMHTARFKLAKETDVLESELPKPITFYVTRDQATMLSVAHINYFLGAYCFMVAHDIIQSIKHAVDKMFFNHIWGDHIQNDARFLTLKRIAEMKWGKK
jgi:hypothetical protein